MERLIQSGQTYDKKGLAPQAPRYTSIDKVLKANKLSQVF